MKKKAPEKRLKSIFIVGTALILLVALGVSNVLEYLFVRFSPITFNPAWYWLVVFGLTSALIGLLLAFFLGKIIFKPIHTITEGMTKLSEGDFSVRIDLGKYEAMTSLSNSFNTLAKELENTEILRSDFVNTFSHEIKTPIVSISGLLPLLRSENLSMEKKLQYLSVIEEEANRLTEMTSNALYLSKVEAQGILTNKTRFNVSEQIRDSFLLLERKWEKKGLIPNLEIDEFTISANMDMLKHVWVNLIDNAIKFSDEGKEITITAEKLFEQLYVSIENYGPEIPESEKEAIFNKFHQCDKSHSTEGYGVGLSIVKHIVTLHGGDILVRSKNRKTMFTVILPIE